MRGLFLYGLHCTKRVWDEIKGRFSTYQIDYVEYPRKLLGKARSVSEITSWVYETYRDQRYDFIAGHSMGGAVALELAARCQVPTKCIILIETNLRPANGFYRNFMMPDNMVKHQEILRMVQEESKYTSKELIQSLQEDFDFTPYIAQIPGKIVGIYGDRGVKDYQGRYDDLCLDARTLERIDFKFVPDSCHMPMIEAPESLSSLILESLLPSGQEKKTARKPSEKPFSMEPPPPAGYRAGRRKRQTSRKGCAVQQVSGKPSYYGLKGRTLVPSGAPA